MWLVGCGGGSCQAAGRCMKNSRSRITIDLSDSKHVRHVGLVLLDSSYLPSLAALIALLHGLRLHDNQEHKPPLF